MPWIACESRGVALSATSVGTGTFLMMVSRLVTVEAISEATSPGQSTVTPTPNGSSSCAQVHGQGVRVAREQRRHDLGVIGGGDGVQRAQPLEPRRGVQDAAAHPTQAHAEGAQPGLDGARAAASDGASVSGFHGRTLEITAAAVYARRPLGAPP